MSSNPLEPTDAERARRVEVMETILAHVRENRTIKLPPFDPSISRPSDEFALQSVGLEPNPFSGSVGPFRYQFEGEEDLLHLIVARADAGPLSAADGQAVAGFLLQGVPSAMIWIKSGQKTQHFYFGHDHLIDNLLL